jgi:flagellar biosynthesis/type III secretory pathway protein FliH
MSAEFLPLWAPDARAFQRATYMSSTDDVELLGRVAGEEDSDELMEDSPQGSSTTPFGQHDRQPAENPEVQDSKVEAASTPAGQVVKSGAATETDAEPMSTEIEGALALLEAEVAGPELDREAVANLEQEAFNRGKASAMAEMAEKIAAITAENERLSGLGEQIEPLIHELGAFRTKMIRQSAEDLSEMAMHMARRVVGETLAVRPQALRKLVTDALDRLPGEDEVTIRVRPEDLSVIENSLPTRRSIRLIGDEDLEGGCVVSAQCGEVAASVDAAFQGLRAAVEDWLEEQK